MEEKPMIHVAAAVVRRGGRYLLTRRPLGSHQGGFWEFPGGKLEEGESAAEALVREGREELGVGLRVGELVRRFTHSYPERDVDLWFFAAEFADGTPRPIEVAELGWFRPDEMTALPILPADLVVVEELARREAGGGAR